ncbi:putative N utilization substance protein B [Neorickettsia risticii str. Illinois]|uniref:N utilization substance protein B n=1 Tax=Neorickettsia risticii (strain Illinois) TaxID=434131 RepID=C6V5Z6_NEORI|nr:transcription antitermination protein NusB [Neorickettsia risticii]ACT69810.1 putative N utilization substance protein B [Neorickettsia risticii str. Illinois]
MPSEKRVARLLSIEVCYSSYFSDLPQPELISRALELQEVPYMRRYDLGLLNSILGLCFANIKADTELIGRFLSEEWEIDRMDNLKLSLLRVAISELRLSNIAQKNLVINEYVSLGRLFLPVKEVGFINAILEKLTSEIQGK